MKLNLSQFPDLTNTINYFQPQYELRDKLPNVDESITYFTNQLNTVDLNDDILYEILSTATADELSTLCYLNKTTVKICQSK